MPRDKPQAARRRRSRPHNCECKKVGDGRARFPPANRFVA